jgi:hypothetical protein
MAMDTTLNEGVWIGYLSCFYHKNEENSWFPYYLTYYRTAAMWPIQLLNIEIY